MVQQALMDQTMSERIAWAMRRARGRDTFVGLCQHRHAVPRLPAGWCAPGCLREGRRRGDRRPLHGCCQVDRAAYPLGSRSTTSRGSLAFARRSAASASAASTPTRSRTRTTSSARCATRQRRVRTQGHRAHHGVLRDRRADRLQGSSRSGWPTGPTTPARTTFRRRRRRLIESLREIYAALPANARLLLEYKLYEPAFYHTDVQDWGEALPVCQHVGERAQVCVDTGHHAMGVNIEQIVAILLQEGRLGGFDLNDKKYGDDDLMVGSIDPYQLFRICHELVSAMRDERRSAGASQRRRRRLHARPVPQHRAEDARP